MRDFLIKSLFVLGASFLIELIVWGMIWITDISTEKIETLVMGTSILIVLVVLLLLFIPKPRFGVSSKGTIRRLKNKKKFHPSWKDLFDHH